MQASPVFDSSRKMRMAGKKGKALHALNSSCLCNHIIRQEAPVASVSRQVPSSSLSPLSLSPLSLSLSLSLSENPGIMETGRGGLAVG